MKHALALAVALLVAGCGAQSKPINICLQPSDRTEIMRNCDSTIQPLASQGTPAEFVAKQLWNAGNVMLWIGSGEWRNTNYRAVIAEAQKYPDKVTHVYIVDEMNWCGDRVCIGRDDELVEGATRIAHAAGLKTVATITQSVIFAPGFKLPPVDVIGVDPYFVTLDHSLDMGGCNLSTNTIANQYLCSVQKLRLLGYTGPSAFVGQGFGLKSDTHEFRMMYLRLQAEAFIYSAPDAVMSYGCFLGADALEREPNLVPLCNTPYEALVTP